MNEISLKKWLKVPVIICLLYIFYKPIKCFALPVTSKLFEYLPEVDTSPYIRSYFFLSLLIYYLFSSIKKYNSNKKISKFSIYNVVIVFILYKYITNDKEIYFYNIFNDDRFLITDILFIVIFLKSTSYIYEPNNELSDNKFISEDFDLQVEDELDRKEQAKSLVRAITNTKPERAINISVISNWGNGKTVFMDFIKRELNSTLNSSENVIIIDFNPWVASQDNNIIMNLFDILQKNLKRYHSDIASDLHKYSYEVINSNPSDNLVDRMITSFAGSLLNFNGSTVEYRKEIINNTISKIEKRIVVFIDDLDRLSSEEILLVFRLIRNTADFKNTFFIVAFDIDYIKSSLKGDNKLGNIEEYLKKIFQLQIVLSPVRMESISEILIDKVSEYTNNDPSIVISNPHFTEEFNNAIFSLGVSPEIANLIPNINTINKRGILELCIGNIRDIKLFLNSFFLSLHLSKNNLIIKDLILLELLKLKFSVVYMDLSKGSFLEVDGNRFKVDNTSLDNFIKSNQYDENNSIIIKKIIGDLYCSTESTSSLNFSDVFKEKKSRSIRSILYIDNHVKYFNHGLFGDFSANEIIFAKNKGIEELYILLSSKIEPYEDPLDFSITQLKNQRHLKHFYELFIKQIHSENDIILLVKSLFKLQNITKYVEIPDQIILYFNETSKVKDEKYDTVLNELKFNFNSSDVDYEFISKLAKIDFFDTDFTCHLSYYCAARLFENFDDVEAEVKEYDLYHFIASIIYNYRGKNLDLFSLNSKYREYLINNNSVFYSKLITQYSGHLGLDKNIIAFIRSIKKSESEIKTLSNMLQQMNRTKLNDMIIPILETYNEIDDVIFPVSVYYKVLNEHQL
ncbi:hypothetical protein DSL64_21495 [Dyadobacter luteus]|uniref:KAP NTPase domain-containing protein n=1 Tax=Dyadobacter luteus TaxID=2259619 RepID=A0A3D8Y681_9BACT|nr:P-loop NTPase fold protein [Dyadobacter luteus]REA58185.1 hypothetical protein DSL64_21495 [Dyadobacter luteus]